MAGTAGPVLGDLPVSNVELSLSCSNLKDLDHFSKSDPVVFVFEKMGKDWTKIGRTEVIMDNLDPEVGSRGRQAQRSNFHDVMYGCCYHIASSPPPSWSSTDLKRSSICFFKCTMLTTLST